MKTEKIKSKTMIFLILLTIFMVISFGIVRGFAGISKEGPDEYCNFCHIGGNDTDGTTNQNCISCHSSTSSDTIIQFGGNYIPIVYNMVEPFRPLAGGNFYWVAQGDDSLGHNVYGISDGDSKHTRAPGKTAGCGNSCHTSLALEPAINNSNKTGCEGCHVFVAHHDDSRPWYRFLKGHSLDPTLPFAPSAIDGDDYVIRTLNSEDNDWEYTSSSTDHNFYKGKNEEYLSVGFTLQSEKTVRAFCSGCHGVFHGPKRDGGKLGTGSASPWIRHPTDILLPNSSEHAGYDPVNDYSIEAPVAWINPENPIRDEAVVTCISCHRAHGSPYPDMLRWDPYTSDGCLNCHTQQVNKTHLNCQENCDYCHTMHYSQDGGIPVDCGQDGPFFYLLRYYKDQECEDQKCRCCHVDVPDHNSYDCTTCHFAECDPLEHDLRNIVMYPCNGDFDQDRDVDGSDLAFFVADFGRTDCSGIHSCEGDFDNDGDVDGSDLTIFAVDFGRTDCSIY